MKSIKEKAEENCIKYGSLGDIAYSEFIDGANYVLDAIEDVLSHPRRFVNADIFISEAMIVEITKIVEQLKETNK